MSGAGHELTASPLFRLCLQGGNLGPKPANMKSRLEIEEDRLSHLVVREYFETRWPFFDGFWEAVKSASSSRLLEMGFRFLFVRIGGESIFGFC